MQNAGYMPLTIVAGESIWISASNTAQNLTDITFSDYSPAGGYSLAYHFAAATPITVDAVANGDNDGWTLEVTAAQTLVWKAGTIRFAGYVTDSNGRVFAADAGTIAVTPSPLATSAWTDVITACDAAILDYAGNPHGSINVDGMSISYRSMDQLTRLRAYAKTMELQETGNRPKRIIRARFT